MSEESPARRFTDVAEAPGTLIGGGIHIKGSLTGGGDLDLAGTLDGDCRITGLCRVRESARLAGDITAGSIVVEGEVTGRLLVAERVEMGAGARVRGSIRARVVAIAEGAFFDGDVNMDGSEGTPPAAPTSFKEKRRRRE